ncbi:MAG TPA: hypothetical protein VN833_07095 [Candidatus Acidoferrales bacterium]|nr:hypothetical protein [Candidatus Acidoferrales bacterium]
MKNVSSLALLGVFASAVLYTAVRANAAGPLPDIFRSVLTEVKAKTKVPVLLPSELPFYDVKHATVDKAAAGEYSISLYFELGEGNAGFAASFGASDNSRYSPQELPNVREVKLATGITGFFRPVNCGGSCAPANLWWKEESVLYQIQLKLPPAMPEQNQQRMITAAANSSILAGPR